MTVEITVRGTFTSSQPPERGTVHATVGYEGPEMDAVYRQVVDDLTAVQESIASLYDETNGPITWWSTQDIRTWSARPWNSDGEQLPLVHHAKVGIEVKFRDFAQLSRWVGAHVTGTTGFSLNHVTWALTVKRRDELREHARTRAVQDAAKRAQQYADALQLGAVRPIAIADAGMLGVGAPPMGAGDWARTGVRAEVLAADAVSEGQSGVELSPEDVKVYAMVDARFAVG